MTPPIKIAKIFGGVENFIFLCKCLLINIIQIIIFLMDNTFKIKQLRKEYVVTLDGRPVCPGFNDEPGIFDNDILPIYRSFVNTFGERVKMACVTTFVEDDVKEDGENPE